MQRPANYSTKHGKAILAYLAAEKERHITAPQIAAHLEQAGMLVSRPTIYRQLDKLIAEGKIRKFSFDGISGSCFQYIDPQERKQGGYHLKCEVCNEIFDLECHAVDHVSRHILERHAFQVNDQKTVFYGRCKTCQHD